MLPIITKMSEPTKYVVTGKIGGKNAYRIDHYPEKDQYIAEAVALTDADPLAATDENKWTEIYAGHMNRLLHEAGLRIL